MVEVDHPDGTPSVTTRKVGDTVILEIGGELDIATAPDLRSLVEEAVAGEPGVVVLDLSAVTFLDSAGIHCLTNLHNQRNGRMRFAAPSQRVLRPLQLTGMDAVLDIYPTVRQALIAVAASGQ